MLKLINISKEYGKELLFKEINLTIGKKEKLGIVGRNGSGKTTLLKIITKEETPDTGEVILPKNYRLGYLKQNFLFHNKSVIEECSAIYSIDEIRLWEAKKILFGLGFERMDLKKNPLDLSGGFQLRLMLAKELLKEPNLLILDEPTNFLDIIAIRWLTFYLKQWKGELILVSHNRTFLDSICSHTAGLHRRALRKITGNTSKYYERILTEDRIYEKYRSRLEKKEEEVKNFINRFRAKARHANLVQSRIKVIEKNKPVEKFENLPVLKFTFKETIEIPEILLRIENLSFSYNMNKNIINNFSIEIHKNEKIGVIGRNGTGKTTLLKLLAGLIKPKNGNIVYHPRAELGYFEQSNIKELNEKKSILDEIESSIKKGDQSNARDICGVMLFSGDKALKKISLLSGGEKCCVLIGKIIAKPNNILLLDEPSHHLDMQSVEALAEAIKRFKGSVIIVTHDESLLKKTVDKLIVFKEDSFDRSMPYLFPASYKEFIEKIGWQDINEISNRKKNNYKKNYRKAEKKNRAELIQQKSKKISPLNKEIKSIEAEIMELEDKINIIQQEIIDYSASRVSNKLKDATKKLHITTKIVNTLYEKLDEKINILNSIEKEFEKLLN